MDDITPWVLLLGMIAVIAVVLLKFRSLQRTVSDMDTHVRTVTDQALPSLKIAIDQTNQDVNKAKSEELTSRQILMARMEGYEKAAMTPVESVGGLMKAFQDSMGTTFAGLQQDMGILAKGTQERLTAFDSDIKGVNDVVGKIVSVTEKFGELNSTMNQVRDVFVGAPAKGKAGEELLKKHLDVLIEMGLVKTKQQIGKDNVEFAIAFSDKKLMPIDATVRCTKELTALSDEKLSREQRIELAKDVKKEVQAKIEDVQKYIMPPTTVEHAIVTVPDGAMQYVTDLTSSAVEKGIFLIRFSALAPFVRVVSYIYDLYIVRGDVTVLQEKISRVKHEISGLDKHFFRTNFESPLEKMGTAVNTIKETVRAIDATFTLKSGEKQLLTQSKLGEGKPQATSST